MIFTTQNENKLFIHKNNAQEILINNVEADISFMPLKEICVTNVSLFRMYYNYSKIGIELDYKRLTR